MKLSFIIPLALAGLPAKAQQAAAWEFGLLAGTAHYQGELAKHTIVQEFTRPSVGIVASKALKHRFLLQAQLGYAQLAANDHTYGKQWSQAGKTPEQIVADGWQYGKNPGDDSNYDRLKRNLSFFTNIVSVGIAAGRYVIASEESQSGLSLSVQAGVSLFYFNPKTELNGNIIALRNVRTEKDKLNAEGGLKTYSRINVSVPVGCTLRLPLRRGWSLAGTITWHKTYTDWIDDVHGGYPGSAIHGDLLAQQLSDRSGEVVLPFGSSPLVRPTYCSSSMIDRGDPRTKDSFLVMQFGFFKKLNR